MLGLVAKLRDKLREFYYNCINFRILTSRIS